MLFSLVVSTDCLVAKSITRCLLVAKALLRRFLSR